MTCSNRFIYQNFKFFDVLAFITSLFLLTSINSHFNGQFSLIEFMSIRLSLTNFVIIVALVGFYIFLFEQFSLYEAKFLKNDFVSDTFTILKVQGVITVALLAVGNLFDISIFSGWYLLLIFWPSSTLVTILFRYIVWSVLKRLHLGDSNIRNVLFLGNCDYAKAYAEQLKNEECKIVGHLSADPHDVYDDPQTLGCFADFEKLLKNEVIDELVVFTDTSVKNEALHNVIVRAHAQGIMLRFPVASVVHSLFKNTEMTQISLQNIGVSSDDMSPELIVRSGYQLGSAFLFKRIIDLTVAVLGLLFLTPLFAVCILLINLESRGGAFFVQERYGYNGRTFRLIKFRTMVQNADALQDALRETSNELDGAAFKMKNDPRITALGRFLRKSSIDELPQLINVLKGDMSLVGPRPLPHADYKRFTNVEHLRRLSVLPGITGSWQVDGRNDLSFDEWMKLDSDYIDHWSHWLDLKILLKTVPAVLKGKGAS